MTAQTQAPALHLAHTANPVTPRERLLRLPQVEGITGFKKSTLYHWIKEGNFPRGTPVGKMRTWSESSVYQWVQDRIQESHK